MRLFALIRTSTLALAVAFATNAQLEADVVRVRAGTRWDAVATFLRPGDEICLGTGKHLPAVLEGLKGTEAQPIVIRSDPSLKLAEIEGGSYGLRLIGCEWVRVERLAIRTAGGVGVSIEPKADSPSHDILLRDLLIDAPDPEASVTGISVERSQKVVIDSCFIQNCRDASIRLASVREAQIRKIQSRINAGSRGGQGLRIEGDSHIIIADDLYFRGPFGATLDLATPRPLEGEAHAKPSVPSSSNSAVTSEPDSKPNGSRVAASEIHISRCRAIDVNSFLSVGNVSRSTVNSCTVVDPRDTVYEIECHASTSPGARLEFGNNLIVWEPGRLKRIASVSNSSDESILELARNLWWSKEIAVALPILLGGFPGSPADATRFPGKLLEPQVIDVDPQLGRFSIPENSAAKSFGSSS